MASYNVTFVQQAMTEDELKARRINVNDWTKHRKPIDLDPKILKEWEERCSAKNNRQQLKVMGGNN